MSLIKAGNGTFLPIKHVGHSTVSTYAKPLRLSHIFHVSQLSNNLLSVRQLYHDINYNVVFNSDFFSFKNNILSQVLSMSIWFVFLLKPSHFCYPGIQLFKRRLA